MHKITSTLLLILFLKYIFFEYIYTFNHEMYSPHNEIFHLQHTSKREVNVVCLHFLFQPTSYNFLFKYLF